MLSRLNGRSLLRSIGDYGVEMSTLKFEPASVPSANAAFDRSDVRIDSLGKF